MINAGLKAKFNLCGFVILFSVFFHSASAQVDSTTIKYGNQYPETKIMYKHPFSYPYINQRKFEFKFYPADVLFGQLFQSCTEFRFALEYRFAKHQSLLAGTSAEIPGLWGAFYNAIDNLPSYNGYWLYGGRGIIGYRYYLTEGQSYLTGWYVGIDISVNGLISKPRMDADYIHLGVPDFQSQNNIDHFILTNYNLTFGYHLISKKLSFDVGASVGYRYDYFWRHYSFGNYEFDKNANNSDLYTYLKKVPVGAAINITIGRAF